jgi:prepilin-type N-terminal cleavage/methylation domain-containing protein
MRNRRESGVTLIEVLIAVTLLSLLSVGMLFAMRVGLNAWGKANDRLMRNRRVAGAHRAIEAQIAGLMPVFTACQNAPTGRRIFFQGELQSMRFVSSYSLQEAWRGAPHIIEFQVIPRDGGGVRLIVNETPYTGPQAGLLLCLGAVPDPLGGMHVRFAPITPGPRSFVLADRLEYCRFAYLDPPPVPNAPERWVPEWVLPRWPAAVRVEMASAPDSKNPNLRPITFVAPVHIRRSPEIQYVDE